MEFLVTLSTLLLSGLVCLAQPYHPRYQPAPIGHDGRVVDTPEVAQAKAAHLAAFSKVAANPHHHHHHAPGHHYAASAAAPAQAYHAGYSNPGYYSNRVEHGPYGYRGPPAPLAQDGRVVDTPEVVQAKAAHFAAFNHAAQRSYEAPAPASYQANSNESGDYDSGAYHPGNYEGNDDDDGSASYEAHASERYQGPPAPLAQDGRVIDTPEVAQAKAAHLAAFQKASYGHVPYAHGRDY